MARVNSLTLTDSGQRYTSVPTVTIAVPDTDSQGAIATAEIDSFGGVNSIVMQDVGNYYTTAPTVTFGSPTTDSANATASVSSTDSDQILAISIDDSGTYYTTVPNVTIGPPTLDSATAAATPNMDGGLLSTATLTSAGRYYTTRPTVTVSKPLDSDLFDKTNRIFKKFGDASLYHNDSDDASSLPEFDSTHTIPNSVFSATNAITETGLWAYLDSVEPQTLYYSATLRTFIDSNGYVGVSFLGGTPSTIYSDGVISKETWSFIQLQTLQQGGNTIPTRLSLNGSHGGTVNIARNNAVEDPTVRFGFDSSFIGPIPTKRGTSNPHQASSHGGREGNVLRSFKGYIDNFTITSATGRSSFDSDESIREPDSANDFFFNTTPAIHQDFNFGQAFILAYVDSGVVDRLLVTESGGKYSSPPTISFTDPTGSPYTYKATATASVNSSTGKVSGITVTYPGKFYDSDSNPVVTIDSATGTAADFRAQGTAVVTNGSILDINITDSGVGKYYLDDPTVEVQGPTGTAADFRATGRVFLDSDTRKIRRISLTDGGRFYATVPAVTIAGGDSTADFAVGETVNQTLSTGVVMSGEVAKWSDSDNKLYIIHAGADDGNYHNFVTGRSIVGANTGANGNVLSVTEDNKISENEQNDEFSPSTSNELDFLDFTENNPFGDPENN